MGRPCAGRNAEVSHEGIWEEAMSGSIAIIENPSGKLRWATRLPKNPVSAMSIKLAPRILQQEFQICEATENGLVEIKREWRDIPVESEE